MRKMTLDEKQESKESKESKEFASKIKELVGVVSFEIGTLVTDDLCSILERKGEDNVAVVDAAMDGYILALSRIVETQVAWRCICDSFRNQDKEIPDRYYKVFNMPTKGDEK